MTVEELCIKNIEAGIRALRLRTKTPKEANVGINLNKLKEVNIGMYEEYLAKYKVALEAYKKESNEGNGTT
jgi:hypothetical protein